MVTLKTVYLSATLVPINWGMWCLPEDGNFQSAVSLVLLHYIFFRMQWSETEVKFCIHDYTQVVRTSIKPNTVRVKSAERNKISFSTFPPPSPISTGIMRIGCYIEVTLLIFIQWHYESMAPVASDIIKWRQEYSCSRWRTLSDGFKSNNYRVICDKNMASVKVLCWHKQCVYSVPILSP